MVRATRKARSHYAEAECRRLLVEQVSQAVKTFIEAFQAMDVRQQKAKLQTLLKTAYIYRDGRIELEFREIG